MLDPKISIAVRAFLASFLPDRPPLAQSARFLNVLRHCGWADKDVRLVERSINRILIEIAPDYEEPLLRKEKNPVRRFDWTEVVSGRSQRS